MLKRFWRELDRQKMKWKSLAKNASLDQHLFI